MKYFYTTPEIKIEELERKDVLCTSGTGTDDPTRNGVYNIEGSARSWTIEDSL